MAKLKLVVMIFFVAASALMSGCGNDSNSNTDETNTGSDDDTGVDTDTDANYDTNSDTGISDSESDTTADTDSGSDSDADSDTAIPLTIPRGRPHLNADMTSFVAENGQLLRGPYTSAEWGDPAPYDELEKMKELGFNAVHIYGECFDINYPNPGSTAPGYSSDRLDTIVQATKELGLYLIITIGNGANNGNFNYDYTIDFWKYYAPRYANETHVLYEIHNEPVAWGPSYLTATTPSGAMDMEIAAYKTIREAAPDTLILLFSYSVLGGTGGTDAALTDIHYFNQAVFGDENAKWDNMAVGFHGYAGGNDTPIAVEGIINAGYPCMMTEFISGAWGKDGGGLYVEHVTKLEHLKVSWLAFIYVPPWGVSDNVALPEVYSDRVEKSGLSWTPDFGNFPVARGPYGNDGLPWSTPDYANNSLSGSLRLEAENFDNGGNGVAYYNKNTSNPGGEYRLNETVGIETSSDGGYCVSSVAPGDWLEYTIQVPVAGTYDLRLHVAGISPGKVQILLAGEDITGEWTLSNTGGLQSWTTDSKSVFLTPGQQLLRVKILSGGFNMDWIEFSPAANGPIATGTYRFRNLASSQLLTLDGDNTVITSSGDQQWNVEHLGGGNYKVTLPSNGEGWTTWMGPLHVGPWWGPSGDRCFIIVPTGSGHYQFYAAGNGKPFQPSTDNAPKLDQAIWTGATEQQWTIE